MPLDRTSAVPLHAQVRQQVGDDIESGVFVPGARLPTEAALAERFGVHRLTVRQAMADLARAGVVVVRQGAGTFVADARVPLDVVLTADEWLEGSRRTAQVYAARGVAVRHERRRVVRAATRGEVARELAVAEALVVETVQWTDGRPTMRALHWLVTDAAPDDVPAFEGSGAEVLTDMVGEPMFYAWRAIGAVAATADDAELLDLAVGAPLLQRCGLNTAADGRPLMYVDRRFRSDQLRFVMRRQGAVGG